jgi:hypothetical protein
LQPALVSFAGAVLSVLACEDDKLGMLLPGYEACSSGSE